MATPSAVSAKRGTPTWQGGRQLFVHSRRGIQAVFIINPRRSCPSSDLSDLIARHSGSQSPGARQAYRELTKVAARRQSNSAPSAIRRAAAGVRRLMARCGARPGAGCRQGTPSRLAPRQPGAGGVGAGHAQALAQAERGAIRARRLLTAPSTGGPAHVDGSTTRSGSISRRYRSAIQRQRAETCRSRWQ